MSDTWVPEGEDQVIEPDGTVVDTPLDKGHHEPPPPPWEPPPEPQPEPEQRIRLDVYHHFDGPVPLSLVLSGAFQVTVVEPTPPPPPPAVAVKAVLTIKPTGGSNMAVSFSVDDTTATATVQYTDDHGDATVGPNDSVTGAEIVPDVTSDTTTVLTVAAGAPAADGTPGKYTYALTPVAEGSANVGVAALANSDGSPVYEADGTTPFGVGTPVAVSVTAGEATGLSISVAG